MGSIRAINAVEVTVERGHMSQTIVVTMRSLGSKGATSMRAFFSPDQASELAAAIANRVDEVRRG